ncbi:hypothetical protein ScPMuIL_016196 [Solemya velum]
MARNWEMSGLKSHIERPKASFELSENLSNLNDTRSTVDRIVVKYTYTLKRAPLHKSSASWIDSRGLYYRPKKKHAVK